MEWSTISKNTRKLDFQRKRLMIFITGDIKMMEIRDSELNAGVSSMRK